MRSALARRVCLCGRQQVASQRYVSRSFITTTIRDANVPSPLTRTFQPDELRRKFRPKATDSSRIKLEEKELRSRSKRATAGIILCSGAVIGTIYYYSNVEKVKNDAAPPAVPGLPETSVAVETVETGTSSVPTFPKLIHLADGNEGSTSMPIQGDQEYQLVGLGIRTVSFLGIQVYVVGMYVNTQDIATLQERLIRTQDPVATTLVPGEKGQLRAALLDADKSEEIWNQILQNGGIRSAFRIVPTRSTDFNHLKDGFLRQMTGKSQHFAANRNDQTFSDESFGQSVDAFKQLMSSAPRKNLPKGEILLLSRDAKGRMSAWYEDKNEQRTKFGRIEDERISRLVWLQYLSGKSPSSEGARKSVVDGCMEYVERPVGTVAAQVV